MKKIWLTGMMVLAAMLILSIGGCDLLNGGGTTDKPAKPGIPAVPNTKVVADGIEITWASVKDATSYILYRNDNQNSPYMSSIQSPYADEDGIAGTSYKYAIVAHNEQGDSEKSTWSSPGRQFPLTAGKKPSAPTNVEAHVQGTNVITVTWEATFGVTTGYNIYFSTNNSGPWSTKIPGSGTVNGL